MTYHKAKYMVLVFILMAACAAVVTGTVLTADTKPVVAKPVAEMLFKPGDITGVIFDSAGRSVAEVDVTAKNSQGEVIARTKTDKSGRYTLKNVERGKYTIYVGSLKSSALRVTQDSKFSSLTIVTPSSSGSANRSGDPSGRSPSNSRFSWNSIQLSSGYVTVGGPVGPQDPIDPEPWDENVSP